MSKSQAICECQTLVELQFSEPVRVETVRDHGGENWNVGLVGLVATQFRSCTVRAHDFESLRTLQTTRSCLGNHRLGLIGLEPIRCGSHTSLLLASGSRARRWNRCTLSSSSLLPTSASGATRPGPKFGGQG
jgi:hypothetical protein